MVLIGVSDGDELALETRKKNAITNFRSNKPTFDGARLNRTDLIAKYPDATHRSTQPSAQYNCHGLTFASRRTQILDPAEVEKILREDGYVPVAIDDICAGDVVVYRRSGEIIHSGVVVGTKAGIPVILSKWGELHEVIHLVNDSEYHGNPQFLRIAS